MPGTIEVKRAKRGEIQINVGDALEAIAEVAYRRGLGKAAVVIAFALAVVVGLGAVGLMTWRDLARQQHVRTLEDRARVAELRALCAERQFDRVFATTVERAFWITSDGMRRSQRACVHAELTRLKK